MRTSNPIPFAKIITVLAVSFGVGIGICGLNLVIVVGKPGRLGGMGETLVPIFGILGALVMVLSSLALVITTIVWVLVEIFRRRGATGGSDESIRLPDDKDDAGPKDSM